MGAPLEQGTRLGIILRVIVLRNVHSKPSVHIPVIFIVQSISVIFRMAGDKYLLSSLGDGQIYASLLGLCQYRQFPAGVDGLCRRLRMSAVRCQENIIESPYQRDLPVGYPMLIDSG